MSKYSDIALAEAPAAYINVLVAKEMGKKLSNRCRVFDSNSAAHLDGEIEFNPVEVWEDCYPVMDALLEKLTGVMLNDNGSATGMIGSEDVTISGGHCRAICGLYLLQKDYENRLQNA